MRRQRRTKILATVGPASRSPNMLASLFQAGVDVFRLNFSHGVHEDHAAAYAAIRGLEARVDRPIGILADLQGPKHRIGVFKNGPVELEKGDEIRVDLDPAPGDKTRVSLPHPEIYAALEPGALLLVDDGRMRFEVVECDAQSAVLRALVTGVLSDRKGVNLPNRTLPVSALTDKDHADLNFALKLGVDWVAQSFVQAPQDVAELRRLVSGRAGVMAKIEKPAAYARIAEILDHCDGIMVARGDLGVEAPPEDVPIMQKKLVRAARDAGKPVVVATQMLESMIQRPAPTRAEASDVATAVFDGADAVMLSAETASGSYPVEAAEMMNRILEHTERADVYAAWLETVRDEPESTAADAITHAARLAADTIRAAVIVTYTHSGSTAIRMSRERPLTPLMALTPDVERARRLSLAWGLHCVRADDQPHSMEEMTEWACDFARREAFAAAGERVVITAGLPFGTAGTTNLLRIARA
jgi:pyruvate kinase